MKDAPGYNSGYCSRGSWPDEPTHAETWGTEQGSVGLQSTHHHVAPDWPAALTSRESNDYEATLVSEQGYQGHLP